MVISGGIFQVALMGFTGLCLFFPALNFKISPVDNISQYKALKNKMSVSRITQQLSPYVGCHLSWKSFSPSIRFYLLFFIIHKC
jgi:hypothetical protein